MQKKIVLMVAMLLSAVLLLSGCSGGLPLKPDGYIDMVTPAPGIRTGEQPYPQIVFVQAITCADVVVRAQMLGIYKEVASTGDTNISVEENYYYIVKAVAEKVYVNNSVMYPDLPPGSEIVFMVNSSQAQQKNWLKFLHGKVNVLFLSDFEMMDALDSENFGYKTRFSQMSHFVALNMNDTTLVTDGQYFDFPETYPFLVDDNTFESDTEGYYYKDVTVMDNAVEAIIAKYNLQSARYRP